MPRYFGVLLLICLLASTTHAAHTRLRLVLSHETARAGETILAGVELKMEDGWHTYWRNPGESGGATEIQWQLPEGITAGPIQWPVPEKYVFEEFATYIYRDEVVLLVPLTISSSFKPGPQTIQARVSWLECAQLCLPGNTEVTAALVVGKESRKSTDATIEAAEKALPQIGAKTGARIVWDRSRDHETRLAIVEWPTRAAKKPDFFSFETQGFDIFPKTDVLSSDPGNVRLLKIVKKIDGDWPKEISGLLVEDTSENQQATAYEVTLPVIAPETLAAEIKIVSQTTPTPLGGGFLAKLLAAFLGGLILNIMPCVLPVIALKILGFVQQSKESPKRVFKLGLVYTAGVLISFLALAAVIITVQKAGGAATWGMQMQYPHYRFALMIVATLVALNLFGLFEINLGGRAMQTAGELTSKEGAPGAFFNGVLATALATPCTAPFLAPAVGFAFGQPPLVIVVFFLAVGLGLASPYLLLSWRPQWLKFIPKPGPWMERFKKMMGFPMLATAAWLFSLTTPSFGEDGVLGIGLFLICLTMFVWIWGEFIQRGRKRKGLAVVFAVGVLAVGYLFGLEDQAKWRTPQRSSQKVESKSTNPEAIPWQPWSSEAVDKARAEGHPVLVDFTAKWCLTCKANKRSSIEIDSVRKKLKEINAVAFVADNTDPDPWIAAELERFGVAGVPLVVVYPPDANKPAIILPTLLRPGIVLDALTEAAK